MAFSQYSLMVLSGFLSLRASRAFSKCLLAALFAEGGQSDFDCAIKVDEA